ncbi:MAG: PRC-barrel domain-containing protein [Sphingomonadaceae bacterium]
MAYEIQHSRGNSVEPETEQIVESDLVPSDRLDDTSVFRPDGQKLGQVSRFMVSRRSGRVRYVEMKLTNNSSGDELLPVPWKLLSYNSEREGYICEADDETLKNSPSRSKNDRPEWNAEHAAQIARFWDTPC